MDRTNPQRFEGAALVTGGAQGIGWAITQSLEYLGYEVYACTFSSTTLETARAALAQLPPGETPRIHLDQCDVTSPQQVNDWIGSILDQSGRIDVLVNNAIVTEWKTVDACDAQRALQTMRVGFDGMVLTIKSVLPVMQQQRGHIINIGSSAGEMPVGGAPAAYVACKAAVNTYTQSLSAEMIGTNVRVTLIRPGVVAGTDFYRKNPNVANFLPRLVDFVPDVTPPDVANAVIKAIKKGKSSVVDIPRFLPLFYLVFRLSPGLTTRLLRIGGKTKQDYGEVEWSYR